MVVFHPEDLEPVFRIAFATIRIQILALDRVDILGWPPDRRERALDAFRESVGQKLLIQPISLREASEVAKTSIRTERERTDLQEVVCGQVEER